LFERAGTEVNQEERKEDKNHKTATNEELIMEIKFEPRPEATKTK